MRNISQTDLEAVLKENDSERATLVCSKHNYTGNRIPPQTQGCKDCWFTYYVWDIATTPPSKRQERLEELESVVRHAIEFEQKGQFGKDLELYDTSDERFKVKIERGVEDTDEFDA